MATATLTFDDEFNSLNLWNGTSGTWQPSFTWAADGESVAGSETWWSNPGYGPTSAADANPYKVSNGVLNLEALPTPADVSASAVGGQPYIGGLLETQNSFSQEYGYFEMNAEMPVGAGLMGAFWLLPENGSRPPELDVSEVVSNSPTTVVNTVITNDGGPDTVLNHWTDVANMTTGFHTYAVDWEPTTITWYFDGVETFQEATPSDMHQPMYMLLDTLAGNASSWEGAPNSTTPFPASMLVNYVHVYSANPYTSGTTVVTPPATTPAAPASVTTGSGSDTLTLAMSEDAYLGDAEFTVAVDGVQQGGTFTTTALHSASATQNFVFEGNWAPGAHTVTVDFLNDAYGGSSALDRNLYVNSITYDGTNTNQAAELGGDGPVNFSVTDTTAVPVTVTTPPATSAPVTTGSGSDTLTLAISEDAYLGNAEFTVAVDGVQLGGTFTATALHSASATQNFVFEGNWAPGAHTVTVDFLNDAYGGSSALDRNLYVNSITYDGTNTSQAAELGGDGPVNFSVTDTTAVPVTVTTPPATSAPVTTGSGSDTLTLAISEDAYLGNAEFTVAVDGVQLGGTFTATALHSASATQNFVFEGNWAPGAHTVTVDFLNDAYGGSSALDRNLYVNGITYDGTNTNQSAELYGTGPLNFSVTDTTPIPAAVTGAGSDTLALAISEDAYLGNAEFTVAVNGKQLGGTFTATALHSASATQNFVFKGDFGSGTHTVTVDFLNDAYGGSSALDRNLYVNSITYNGTNTNQSAELYGTGPLSFSVSGGTTPAVTETGDHGSLQKNLSQTGTYKVGGDSFVLGSGNADTVTLGTGVSQISFLGASSVSLTGGSGQAVVTADAGTNTFVAGTGSLQVTGGGGSDGYVFHATGGLLTIEDFSLAKGDTLTVDKALEGSLTQASDGNGGVMLSFGTGTGDGIDIHGLASIAGSSIKWA